MNVTVLVATTSFGAQSSKPGELLAAGGVAVERNQTGRTFTPEELVARADGAVGVIAGTEHYTAEVLARLPSLRVISRCGAGMDNVDLAAARARGIAVLNTPDGPTRAVAELTLGLILGLIRHTVRSTAEIRRGGWEKRMGFLVGEVTFGLVGLGRIGKTVASLLRAWEATVIACDLQPDSAWAARHGVGLVDRETLFRQADVVSLHVPYEKDLHHFVDRTLLARMKPGAFLVQASRGGLIDEDALYEALRSGHLGGAAVDVFEKEPYAGRLRELDNVILTPHVGSYARAGRIRMEEEAAQNLLDALRERGLLPSS